MEKIQTFLRSILKSSKKTMGMVIILLVAVAVPITLGLIKQNQDNRQEAATSVGTTEKIAQCKAVCNELYANATSGTDFVLSGCKNACEMSGGVVPSVTINPSPTGVSSSPAPTNTPSPSGTTSSDSITVGNFTPIINGDKITFTISGTSKGYWVYVMRSSTAPDKSKSTQYTTLQNYDSSLPQENTFYRAQVSSNGSVSFAKPTREGPYWIVVNGHSESVQVPGSLTDSVCAWDGKLYKYTASGGVESTGSCTNVGVKGVASDTSSGNPGDGGTGGNTGGNTGTTNPTGGVFPTRPQGPSLWDKIRCQNSCRNSRARDLEKLCIDKCLADVGNNGNPGGATGGQNMNLALTVSLPGIGSGQDASTSGTTGNNMNPKRTTRQGQMQIFNMNNEQVKSSAVSFTYSASGSAQQTGVYTSTVNIDGISPGTYYIKLSMDNTLFTQVSGVITLKEGNNTVPRVTLIPGDLNQDNNLNMSDHSIFVGCYGKKECPADEKTRSDFNDDGVIDGKDYNILIRAFAIRAGA